MKYAFLYLFIILICPWLFAQSAGDPFAHTYSIIAVDPEAGEIGGAVQSHWFSVGTVVLWGEAGTGIIATQSFVNVSFGMRGLEMLRKGMPPQQVLDSLLISDPGKEFRQAAVINTKGESAAFTGKNCVYAAGNINGQNVSCQANMMLKNTVWQAMYDTFNSTKGPLAEKLIAALQAAQQEGGDIRGQQSAALVIYKLNKGENPWEDKLIDLRVDDSNTPVEELARLLKVHRAYEHMNDGDLAVEKGDMETALKEYSAAEKMFPENEEMKFWHAVTLVNNGGLNKSLPIFKEVFQKNSNWREFVPRLIKPGLLTTDEGGVKLILSQ